MAEAKEQSPQERRHFFRRGFGDGAKFSALKYEDNPDYMEGWEAGRTAYSQSAQEFREKYGLPEPSILRGTREEVSSE